MRFFREIVLLIIKLHIIVMSLGRVGTQSTQLKMAIKMIAVVTKSNNMILFSPNKKYNKILNKKHE